jgi:hypothetical protein
VARDGLAKSGQLKSSLSLFGFPSFSLLYFIHMLFSIMPQSFQVDYFVALGATTYRFILLPSNL